MTWREEGALVLAKPKRPYRSKVRTGCVTCKVRHVKCDEGKPACLKCTSSGRSCHGYLAPPKPLLFEVSQDYAERRSFHYFAERTAPELQPKSTVSSGSPFWSIYVLRASYSHEVVRHATAAIGSFHESLELPPGQEAKAARDYSFKQYNKAISVITKTGQSLPTEDVLIACVLFLWLENLQGNFAISLNHLRSGISILETWRSNRLASTNGIGASAAAIDENIGPMLDRLKLQAAIYLIPIDLGNMPICQPSLPMEFSTFAEAHRHFYRIMYWVCHKLEVGLQKIGMIYVRKELVPRLVSKLNSWLSLLERYVAWEADCGEAETIEDRHWKVKSALHLQIQHRQIVIMLKSFPYDTETLFDKQLGYFEDIVSMSQQFIEEEIKEEKTLAENGTSGASDQYHAIIPSLFLTAGRCRDPQTRRKAIALLRSRRRWKEDSWDSVVAADLVEHLMLLEEKGLKNVASCVDVPDSNRLYAVGASFYAYNHHGKQVPVEHESLALGQTTYGAKLHCIRSGGTSIGNDVEDYWWSSGGHREPVDFDGVVLRDVAGGLFPQPTKSNARLWSVLKGGNAIRCMNRNSSRALCLFTPGMTLVYCVTDLDGIVRTHTCESGNDGDIVTLVGQFSGYTAANRPWPEIGSMKARTTAIS